MVGCGEKRPRAEAGAMAIAPILPADQADLAWLGQLLAAGTWPALTPAAEARLARCMAGLPLERLVSLFEGAPDAARTIPAGYRAWIAANPGSPQTFAACFNLGVDCARLGDMAGAVAAHRQALALRPDFAPAAVNLGMALEALGLPEQALAAWGAALQPVEARTALHNQRGRLLEQQNRFAAAEAELRASLLLEPDQPDVIQHWSHLRQKACLWPVHPESLGGLTREAMALHCGPLGVLALTDDVAQQRRVTAAWLARKVPAAPERLSPREGYRHDRIRIGYLSSDFHRHAMSFLVVELLERHDRAGFEVYGYDSSTEDGSEIRRRVTAAFDHHVPILALDEEAAARRIRQDEIDILVDLNGLTRGARLGCLRWKPAPVQATWLGFIGPVALPELDYFLCDDHAVPPELAADYAPAPLPIAGHYQPNDGRPLALPPVGRAEEGLPEDAFVFCCFAHHYKITPAMYDTWLDILRRVPASVLWLAADTEDSHAVLRDRAAAAGVAPGRLVIAPRVEPARYMARLALADLFLDTTPYNSGTVASDALRMGLPLLTLSGRSFASRMAGSLLRAIGLPEGICTTPAEYAETAVALATDPARHAAWRARVGEAAWSRTLGDTAGFARRVEDAYRRIRLQPPA